MSKVVVFNHVTLDGVMQSPGRADEDLRGGFLGGLVGEAMTKEGALLLWRRTYQDFAAFWSAQDDNPFTAALNDSRKYVASRTLEEPLPWVNSTLLDGDAAEGVAALKQRSGTDLVVLGSGELVQSLMRSNLIDQYVLLIHPLILGSGRRLFTDDGAFATVRLVDTKTSTTGVVIATYVPAEQ
jgi:dihydrofolate reductase